ncbi:MAG: hypothetical protein ACI9VT_004170, partial [Psychroserpens sp.]
TDGATETGTNDDLVKIELFIAHNYSSVNLIIKL